MTTTLSASAPYLDRTEGYTVGSTYSTERWLDRDAYLSRKRTMRASTEERSARTWMATSSPMPDRYCTETSVIL